MAQFCEKNVCHNSSKTLTWFVLSVLLVNYQIEMNPLPGHEITPDLYIQQEYCFCCVLGGGGGVSKTWLGSLRWHGMTVVFTDGKYSSSTQSSRTISQQRWRVLGKNSNCIFFILHWIKMKYHVEHRKTYPWKQTPLCTSP